ncbi:MAG TPA: hypothetical protein VHB79_03515 [Polyangiaceae bacterium]|nr:hypothetical protein [Polyangiaceae bacterium]
MVKLGQSGLASGIVLASLLIAAAAHAEEHAAAPAAPATDAADPDIVRLKNGGLVRGSITELIPGDSVTIVTRAGKTREFSMNEVEYAGSAAKDPQASPPAAKVAAPAAADDDEDEDPDDSKSSAHADAKPYVTVHGREARLQLIANEAGITFHRQVASAVAVGGGGSAYATGYERMCTAPCKVSLPAGTETFALSRDGDPPLAGDPVQLPAGDAQLRGSISSRGGVRLAGWLSMIGGVVGGAALALTSTSKGQTCSFGTCVESTEVNVGQLAAGIAMFGVGLGVGVVLVRIPDAASVEVESASATPGRSLAGARGVALTGHF